MLSLPKQTEVKKQLAKKLLFATKELKTKTRDLIDSQVSRIEIVNAVDSSTINLKEGEKIKSFFVIRVLLKDRDFNKNSIVELSKLIPQNIIMLLEYDGNARLAVYYGQLIMTQWKAVQDFNIELQGFDLDSMYYGIIKSIAMMDNPGIEWVNRLSLDENLERIKKIKDLEKRIASLTKKMDKEKQYNRQLEMNIEIKRLREELNNC